MSWLTDLAGKAEDLLNQIDQTAATSLQKSSPTSVRKGKNYITTTSHTTTGPSLETSNISSSSFHMDDGYNTITNTITPTTGKVGPGDPIVVASSGGKKEERSSGYASSASSLLSKREKREEDEERKLIAYLNQPTSPEDANTSQSRSRKSSVSSLRSLPTQVFKTTEEIIATERKSELPLVQSSSPVAEYTFSTKAERELREVKAREIDLEKALQAKDSQLAVLKVRLQEADDELRGKTRVLAQLNAEKDRLLKDSADSTEVRNHALDTLQRQLQEAETETEREKQNAKRIESEYLSRIQRTEEEIAGLSQQLTTVQKTVTDEKLKTKDAFEQLRLAKYNLEANKHEFDEYKQKAQRILLSKEKLISTLKEGAGIGEGEQGSFTVELEELRAERDILKEDLQQGQLQIYNLKAELQEVESQLAAEQRSSLEQQRSLQEQCQLYQQSASQYREQLEHMKMEYQYIQDELRRQQLVLQAKLHEKDAEIARVMNQTAARSLNASSNVELEQRIQHLTENLIQKQTLIEALQTDKNSLSLQLERLDRMYREAESAALRATSTTVNIGSNDEGGLSARIPTFLRENPYDTGMTRGVKKAYSTVDSLRVSQCQMSSHYRALTRVACAVRLLKKVSSIVKGHLTLDRS